MIWRVILLWLISAALALADFPRLSLIDSATFCKYILPPSDGANRLTNTVSPLGHTSSQFYGNDGLIEETVDPLLRTASFSYDGLGRVSTKWDDAGINDYAYDGNNNLTSIFEYEEPSWIASVFWTYDAYNRVTSYTDAAGTVIQYRYDANGNMTNLVYPGGRTVIYRYDGNNRLTNVTDWAGRQTGYTYDLAGHVTSVSRPNNTVCTMGYDNDGELTNIIEQTTTKFPVCFYTINYNSAGRIQWEFKGPLPHTNTPATRTMTYDNDNCLATFNGTAVTIDANGNLTHGPGTNNTFITYGYNARNELMNAGGLSYHYDGTGNRLSMTNGAVVTSFVTSPRGSQTLMRIQNGATNYYVYGNGLLYESDETATTTNVAFYHFDCRGSTVALTDTNGNSTDLIEYSPYGTTSYRTGTTDTPFLYNGRYGVQTDPNGLLYMRARYYNPYISRFINADPSGFNGGLNFYAFCNDNPISLTDPFGLDATGEGSVFSSLVANLSGYSQGELSALLSVANGALNSTLQSLQNPFSQLTGAANLLGTISADPSGYASSQLNSLGNSLQTPQGVGQASVYAGIFLMSMAAGGPEGELDAATEETSGAENAVNGVRLNQQLSAQSAFNVSGGLSQEAIDSSTVIFEPDELGNPAIPSDVGKYTTGTFNSPSGPFQVHFYMNPTTGGIWTGLDYKTVFNTPIGP